MATTDEKDILKENAPETAAEGEGLGEEIPKAEVDTSSPASRPVSERSERNLFAGDEEFYKLLADSAESPVASIRPDAGAIRNRRFSSLEKVLIFCILGIAAILVYALLKSALLPRADTGAESPPRQGAGSVEPAPLGRPSLPSSRRAEGTAGAVPEASTRAITEPTAALAQRQPTSLWVAETFFSQKDYGKAFAVCGDILKNLLREEGEEPVRDFLQLRMAMCMMNTGDHDGAGRLLANIIRSRSPLVRALTNYHLSLLEMENKQYLKARMNAYQAIALAGATERESDWAHLLECNCNFLAGESVTKKVLSLCDADKDLPEDFWVSENAEAWSARADPFASLNEAQLRSLLNSGWAHLNKGLLGPQIERLQHAGGPPRWSVICNGAPIEELLARFAANAGLEIRWAPAVTRSTEQMQGVVRRRPVSLYMPSTTTQQFISSAAGSVGLMAQLDNTRTVSVCDLASYYSLSEYVARLTDEALSIWQRFLLTFHDDERAVNAHFARGVLQAQRGEVTDAIAEYKLVANRFSRTSLAPLAMLRSSKLKASLHDHAGAREDLKQLVEQYPDSKLYGEACLHLAEVTVKAGLQKEAGGLYKKVYNLCLSPESQAAAALGAGRCLYEQKDYQGAAEWLTRYVRLARDHAESELCSAYLLLGKTSLALQKPQQARDALQYALAGQLTQEQYLETISDLVKIHIQQGQPVEALDVLENVQSRRIPPQEYIEILVLKAAVLRSMGLVNKAVATLGDTAQYLAEPRLKARASLELARCRVAKGDLELAYKDLAETLTLAEPGPEAHEITVELADVCLRLSRNPQAISLCSRLLAAEPAMQIRQRALKVLARAYGEQKDYDKAALALLGRWDAAEFSNDKTAAMAQSIGAAP
ncbi:MAG TPA: tetratricopeptide repeat protein [Sedimentisphaerales bacterium]|nr:tetratricopeptide repeat protein [Sedimentisphaerales bacterium]